jgi:predicted small secreted protein
MSSKRSTALLVSITAAVLACATSFASVATAGGRPPDVSDTAATLNATAPDVLERYAAAHPYGTDISAATPTIVSRPPDVTDAAEAARYTQTGQVNGFDWTDYASGVGSGLGFALMVGVVIAAGSVHRRRVSAA